MSCKTGCQAIFCRGSGATEVSLIMLLLLIEGSPSPIPTHSTLQLENFHFYIFYILNIRALNKIFFKGNKYSMAWNLKIIFLQLLNLVPEKGPRSFQKVERNHDSRRSLTWLQKLQSHICRKERKKKYDEQFKW